MGIGDDHPFSAPEAHFRQGRFVGHPLREAKGIFQSVLKAAIGLNPNSAERRAERRAVDRDHGRHPHLPIGHLHHLLISLDVDLFEVERFLALL